MIPNDKIKDWPAKYEQYQLLLKDIENRKILERKERLIKSREAELKGEILHPVPGRILNHAVSTFLANKIGGGNNNMKVLPNKANRRLSQSMTMALDGNIQSKYTGAAAGL